MFPGTIVRCLVQEVEGEFCCVAHLNAAVACADLTVCARCGEDRTEVYGLFLVAGSMPRHGELTLAVGFRLVGYLRGKGDGVVDAPLGVGSEMYGYHLVGVRGEIFASYGYAVAGVLVVTDGAVQIECSLVAGCITDIVVVDEQGGQRLIE